MQSIIEQIQELYQLFSSEKVVSIDKLPQSGSDRIYFRLHAKDHSCIAAYNTNIAENRTFVNFSRHFKMIGAPVPEILKVNEDGTIYLQQDYGDTSLLKELEENGHSEHVFSLYKKSLNALAHLQINADDQLNYDWCITSKDFGKQAILSDLLYFKYYFLDTLKIPYDKERLINDFEKLSHSLADADHKYFMFRDFQSRNIMIEEGEVYFIDYQGGMKGALQYDVASLLWQAKADLSDNWKTELLSYYITQVEEILQKPVDRMRFETQYNGYVLLRLLQVLGAYGFRGLFERKAHFLTSIPLALRNLKWFINNKNFGVGLPEFERLLQLIVDDKIVQTFEPVKATALTPLVVSINSFSFIKNGYPRNGSQNGGGFVFDCRGILNPGRVEEYKNRSGQDKLVKDFLEQHTKMPEYLNNVYNIVDITVEDFIKRNFESLVINFGCTGGQHRSVYAADAMARHLKNKFGVKTELSHINEVHWVS